MRETPMERLGGGEGADALRATYIEAPRGEEPAGINMEDFMMQDQQS